MKNIKISKDYYLEFYPSVIAMTSESGKVLGLENIQSLYALAKENPGIDCSDMYYLITAKLLGVFQNLRVMTNLIYFDPEYVKFMTYRIKNNYNLKGELRALMSNPRDPIIVEELIASAGSNAIAVGSMGLSGRDVQVTDTSGVVRSVFHSCLTYDLDLSAKIMTAKLLYILGISGVYYLDGVLRCNDQQLPHSPKYNPITVQSIEQTCYDFLLYLKESQGSPNSDCQTHEFIR